MIEPPWICAQLMQALYRENAVLYSHLDEILGLTGNCFTWKMLTLVWKLRRKSPPPSQPPPPHPYTCSAAWSLCISAILSVTCVSSFFPLLFTSLRCVKGFTCSAWAGRMGSWAFILCYPRLSLSPGPCLVHRKDLLCWDTGLCHAVPWHGGDLL